MKELETILEMWEQDCVIDEHHLDKASRQTPKLHAKYLQLLSNAKIRLKRSEMKQKSLLKDKWLYYNGKMSPEEVAEKGWIQDPFDGLKVLKGEMDYYYDSDKEIQASEELVSYWKTIIDTLTSIIDNVKWRHQNINNMIKWRQFQAGD